MRYFVFLTFFMACLLDFAWIKLFFKFFCFYAKSVYRINYCLINRQIHFVSI